MSPPACHQAKIYSLKIFDARQHSYTSWFLDAFNYGQRHSTTSRTVSIACCVPPSPPSELLVDCSAAWRSAAAWCRRAESVDRRPGKHGRALLNLQPGSVGTLSQNHVVTDLLCAQDFTDQPFVDKVRELAAAGIVVVSAVGEQGHPHDTCCTTQRKPCVNLMWHGPAAGRHTAVGNDGPDWGTAVNPADEIHAIGVGGVDNGRHVCSFSSRGMTRQELQHGAGGAGRVKPDVVTAAERVYGQATDGTCSKQSGTSVASPIVAGAVALLASAAGTSSKTALSTCIGTCTSTCISTCIQL